MSIGLVGGTGPEGKGLAARFARAGFEVVIGSRSRERGRETAAALQALAGGNVQGGVNAEAARADVVVITLPYDGQAETLDALRQDIGGRIVISTAVPMRFAGRKVEMLTLAAGSAAQEAQASLPQARVVGAFQNLSASKLIDLDHPLEGDVIVCSDDKQALQEVIDLAWRLPNLRGVDGGPLASSRYVEGITTLLLHVNRNYKSETTLKVVGI